jgi:hypothetical protein
VRKIYVTDSSIVIQRLGHLNGVLFVETNLNPKDNETVCFVGSIVDKSEFYYRQIMNIKTKYITLIEDDIDMAEIANFWIKNSSVMSYSQFRKEFKH